ncbi:MAG TPA: hypothetical protein VGJ39_05785 [Vicinamibacterales bacterium]|jgi:hypothetical protein
MGFQSVPASLQERLGTEGASDLAERFDTARARWSDDVLNLSLDRFERRLVETTAGLRIDIARETGALRGEIAALRTEVKVEMQEGFASIRQEMATNRFELLKWSFLFWVGQVFAIVALVGALMRSLGPVR